MSDELKNIPSQQDMEAENEKLLQYLNNSLANDEQHAFEKNMHEDDFVNDAVEGLQQVENKKDLAIVLQQLNGGLKKQLEQKNKRKEKRKIRENPWALFAILLLLMVCVVGYLIIKKLTANG